MITKYDPNIYWSRQEVEITLMQWDYSAKFKVETGGNVQGWDILESAVDQLHEILLEENDIANVTLTNPAGDTLFCQDDEEEEEDWVKKMIVSVVIVSQEKEQTR